MGEGYYDTYGGVWYGWDAAAPAGEKQLHGQVLVAMTKEDLSSSVHRGKSFGWFTLPCSALLAVLAPFYM